MLLTTNVAKMAQKDFQKRKNSFDLNSFNYKFINPSIFTPPQPVRERPFWGVSHRVEPLLRLHLSPFKGIYFSS